MHIKLYNSIADSGTSKFSRNYAVGEDVSSPDGIMVRSAALHEIEFNPELKAIARAGAGVNNIPVERCTDAGIVVFNTPGANANAVKELVLCGLMLASRDIVEGSKWASGLTGDIAKQVEKGKSRYAGCEIKGKTLGVIGLGAIGAQVADMAINLGMEVIGYDPYISVDGAWKLNHHIRHAANYDEVYEKSDYITIHVPVTPTTKGMINAKAFRKMKNGVRLLNFARADLVVASDLRNAIADGKVAKYVTDFPTDELAGLENTTLIPHLGASTEESEENCAAMAATQLIDYLENGNIRNSVNFPAVSMERSGKTRLCIFNRNIPDVISGITSALSGTNIENMTNKSRDNVAYNIVDIAGEVGAETISKLEAINGVIRVRVIH